jgi:hypothetical protein
MGNEENFDVQTTFTVKLEFECVSAETPLEAVQKLLDWIKDKDGLGGAETFVYDVTNEITSEEYTVDPSEDEENKVYKKN